jgi:hypothetical protein
MNAIEVTIIIFCILGMGWWLLNQFDLVGLRYEQGSLPAAIQDALRGRDMSPYELAKWLKRKAIPKSWLKSVVSKSGQG